MFSKAAVFIASTFALMAIAAPYHDSDGNIANSCNGGTVNCCNQYQSASTFSTLFMETIAGGAGNVGPGIGQVGFDCIVGSAWGGAGNSCSQQPTCCTGNSFNGLIAFGCNPINVNV